MTAVLAVAAGPLRARAEPSVQIWPELDLYLKLGDKTRVELYTQARLAPASGLVTGQVGGQLEFSVKPLRQQLFPTIQLPKKERGTLAIGYRRGGTIAEGSDGGGGPPENRFYGEATFRLLLPAEILAGDRNRFEGRDLGGTWSWRYRNRLQVERAFVVGNKRLAPLASAEVFYDSRYDAWTRLRVEAGAYVEELGLSGSVLELYFLRQWDDRSSSSSIEGAGITFAIYR